MLKICNKCKKELSFEEFHKNKNNKDGLSGWCKKCTKQAYLENREKRLEYQRKYKIENEEKFKEQQKRYKNKSKVKINERNKKYQQDNKNKLCEYRHNYFLKNKNKILNYNREYIKNRRKNDDLFYFKNTIRNLINSSFKRKKLKKQDETTKIIGCDFEELREHLIKTFFKNYKYEYDGKEKVHIDHIIPLATAKTEEDVIKLCHFSNLQLLKAEDNLKKSAKI